MEKCDFKKRGKEPFKSSKRDGLEAGRMVIILQAAVWKFFMILLISLINVNLFLTRIVSEILW